MSEGPNPLPDLWPLVPSGATDWLLDLCGDGPTGFMPPAMPDAVRVLNAMYEHEHGPVDVSYDEYHQARPAEGSTQPHMVGSNGLDDVSIATGGEVWAVPGIPALAGGGCVGPSLPGGPATRWCPSG
ncbi:hypothetical protein [Streptomyces atroolivaceus]|uniref:hypothetical protein n=1 Tax=Streptomyces atroolivaceus TaxID=66869 RepID=UPI0036979C7E